MEGELAPWGSAEAEAILATYRRAVNLATFAAASGGVRRVLEEEEEAAAAEGEVGLEVVASFPETGSPPIPPFSAPISESELSTR